MPHLPPPDGVPRAAADDAATAAALDREAAVLHMTPAEYSAWLSDLEAEQDARERGHVLPAREA
jgi:hypothetical protein